MLRQRSRRLAAIGAGPYTRAEGVLELRAIRVAEHGAYRRNAPVGRAQEEAAAGNLCLQADHPKASAGNPRELVAEVAGAQQGDPGCCGFRQIPVVCQRVKQARDCVHVLLQIDAYPVLLSTSP